MRPKWKFPSVFSKISLMISPKSDYHEISYDWLMVPWRWVLMICRLRMFLLAPQWSFSFHRCSSRLQWQQAKQGSSAVCVPIVTFFSSSWGIPVWSLVKWDICVLSLLWGLFPSFLPLALNLRNDVFFMLTSSSKNEWKLNPCLHRFSLSLRFSQNCRHFPSSHSHSQTPLGAESLRLFLRWGFTGHQDSCSASCYSLEGKLEKIFSKFLCEERVTQHYADPQ